MNRNRVPVCVGIRNLAIKKNLTIQTAKEKIKGAEAQKDEAFTEFLPKFSTSYSYSRLNEAPTYTTPGSTLALPAPIGNVNIQPSTVVMGTKDNFNWSLDARQPIFAGGGIMANYEVNKLGVDISRLEERFTISDIVLAVKTAYYNILKANKLMELAEQSVAQLEAHRNTAKNFYTVGLIPRNDLLRAEVELANGRQMLVKAKNNVQLAKAKLNSLLHFDINAPLVVEDILYYIKFDESLIDSMKRAMENRMEIRVYTLKVEQARKLVSLARSNYFPTVSIAGNYTKYGDTAGVSGSPYQDEKSWRIMAIANWNFWEWGKTKYRVDSGISRENQMVHALNMLKDQVKLEVKNDYLFLREAEKQIQAAEKSIEQAEENFRIVKERYHERMATTTDVIDAQTLLLKAKSDYTNALGDYNIGLARLEKSTGLQNFQSTATP
ncbi:MAG: TolC family protein [Deltaproteobacteria bacterium]|nr:TolC family protein [Deltaproteobacteria bacterium]